MKEKIANAGIFIGVPMTMMCIESNIKLSMIGATVFIMSVILENLAEKKASDEPTSDALSK